MLNWFESHHVKFAILAVVLLVISIACSSSFSSGGSEPLNDEPSEVSLPTQTQTYSATEQLTDLPPTGSLPDPESGAPTPQPVSIDLNTIYSQVIESLPVGSALFNPAKEMVLGQVYEVEVRVSPVSGEEIEVDDDIKATLTADLDTGEPVILVPVRVSTVMSATLNGPNFTINPLTEKEQIRDSSRPYLQWLWEVRPEEKGEQRLTLNLSVVVNAEGLGDKPHTVHEVREITVSGNPLYSIRTFFGENWEWVASGLVLPAIGWLWRWVRSRRALQTG